MLGSRCFYGIMGVYTENRLTITWLWFSYLLQNVCTCAQNATEMLLVANLCKCVSVKCACTLTRTARNRYWFWKCMVSTVVAQWSHHRELHPINAYYYYRQYGAEMAVVSLFLSALSRCSSASLSADDCRDVVDRKRSRNRCWCLSYDAVARFLQYLYAITVNDLQGCEM